MTFAELAAAILEHPDCGVDIDWAFVVSAHAYTRGATERVKLRQLSGIDPRKDPEARTAKKMLQHIHDAITAGDILPTGSRQILNLYSPNASNTQKGVERGAEDAAAKNDKFIHA